MISCEGDISTILKIMGLREAAGNETPVETEKHTKMRTASSGSAAVSILVVSEDLASSSL